jgi:hypothetical protein
MGATGRSSAIAGALVTRFVLPVSGIAVSLRQPTGTEDIILAECDPDDPALALALLERLGEADPAVGWAGVPAYDVDALIVRLRQAVIGDRIVAEATCAAAACGQRVDLSFGLGDYMAHHQPRTRVTGGRGWAVTAAEGGANWWDLQIPGAAAVRFRLPTLGDLVATVGAADPAGALADQCIPGALPSRSMLGRVQKVMQLLAPPLAGPIEGRCPDCGTPITARFEARGYCLRELRERARFVYDDIDAIAERYHWSERAILTLPYGRRVSYAERARQARAA